MTWPAQCSIGSHVAQVPLAARVAARAGIPGGACIAGRLVRAAAAHRADTARHRFTRSARDAVLPGPAGTAARAADVDPPGRFVAILAARTSPTSLAQRAHRIARTGARHALDATGERLAGRAPIAVAPRARGALARAGAVGHPAFGAIAGGALQSRASDVAHAELHRGVAHPALGARARQRRVGVRRVEPVLHAVAIRVAHPFERVDQTVAVGVASARRVLEVDLLGVVDAVAVAVGEGRVGSERRLDSVREPVEIVVGRGLEAAACGAQASSALSAVAARRSDRPVVVLAFAGDTRSYARDRQKNPCDDARRARSDLHLPRLPSYWIG